MNKDDNLLITSTQNPRIKALKGLQKRRERDSSGLIMIEGIREVERAASAGTVIRELFVCPAISGTASLEMLPAGTPTTELSKHVYSKVAYRGSSEGIIAVAQRPATSMESFRKSTGLRTPLILVLDGIEKPGNLGAIIRTADGAGVTGIVVTGSGTDIYSPNVIRSSLGTVFQMNMLEISRGDAVTWMTGSGLDIITSTPAAELLYPEADYTRACAIVVGSEDRGACRKLIEASGTLIRIPMSGIADSLNASASASILLYEAVRQRTAIGNSYV